MYTRGDPINRVDRRGLEDKTDDDDDCDPDNGGYCVFRITDTEEGGGGSGGNESCDDNPYQAACAGDDGGQGGTTTGGPSSEGAAGGTINIKHFSTTSKLAVRVQNDLSWLKQALLDDPTCSNWLTGVQTVIAQALGSLPNQANGTAIMMVGVGSFSNPGVNAVAGVVGTNLAPGTAAITVNVNGAFFNSNVSVGYGVINMTGGSDVAQIEILLHELAHLTGASGFISNDANSASAQTSNNSMVEVMCQSTLNLAGWH
jgi:hypothetical protein